jgi:hypothetical protein
MSSTSAALLNRSLNLLVRGLRLPNSVAINLARWLMRNEDEAADAVQDACLPHFVLSAAFGEAMAAFGCSRHIPVPPGGFLARE